MAMCKQAATLVLAGSMIAFSGCGKKGRPMDIDAVLANRLVDADGREVPVEGLMNADYFLLYFSAHWCPPCQAFTPRLVEFHQNHGGGRIFHTFLVSSDKSEAAMLGYMRETRMPWAAVRYGSDASHQLKANYAGSGIPCLVLIDRSGHVLADSYAGKRYLGPQTVLNDLEKRLAARKSDPPGVSPATKEPLPTPGPLARRYKIEGFGKTGTCGFVMINGQMFSKGDELETGAIVEEVTGTYVEISFEGNRYRLAP